MQLKKIIKKYEMLIRATGILVSMGFAEINLILPNGSLLNVYIGIIVAGIFAFM